jgi:hypothetical protein
MFKQIIKYGKEKTMNNVGMKTDPRPRLHVLAAQATPQAKKGHAGLAEPALSGCQSSPAAVAGRRDVVCRGRGHPAGGAGNGATAGAGVVAKLQ